LTVTAEPSTGPSGHIVQIYDHVPELAANVVPFVATALRRGDAAIVVATAAHREVIVEGLADDGIDLVAAIGMGALVLLDAVTHVESLLVDGMPDRGRFDRTIAGPIRALAADREVRVFGEMVAVLWERGLVAAAIALEDLWNELLEGLRFSLLCAYPRDVVGTDDAAAHMCQQHTAVVGVAAPGDERARHVRQFECDVQAPGEARRFVVGSLERWGRNDLAGRAAIVVTEVATNAVRHARSAFAVEVVCDGDLVRIAVRDASTKRPKLRPMSDAGESGRGLRIVADCAARWGCDLDEGGKTVWAELRR
jgi:anti-sigma regulatory factor (Ser/Thr protein kinase)